MSRLCEAELELGSLFVPVVHDPGGFVACYCCLCSARLVSGHATYHEGPVCVMCDMIVQRGVFFDVDGAPTAKGGAS